MRSTFLLAACMLAICAPAAFAAEGGHYLGLHGGLTVLEEAKNESDSGSFNFDFDQGWAAGATLGYDLRETYPAVGTGRLELEFGWRENDVDDVEFAQPSLQVSGQAKAASLMFNTIGESYDFLPWVPYLGVGIGAARITLDQVTQGGLPLVDDDDTVFAWQILAGFAYRAGSVVTFDLGYRFFSAVDPEFTDAAGIEFESDYDSHNVTLGARFDF